jgi:hypothetical protein
MSAMSNSLSEEHELKIGWIFGECVYECTGAGIVAIEVRWCRFDKIWADS